MLTVCYDSDMTGLLPDEREFDATIFTTDRGPMIVSRQHPKRQLLTDPAFAGDPPCGEAHVMSTLPAFSHPGQLANLGALAAIPEEEIWLASQKSARTRCYRRGVRGSSEGNHLVSDDLCFLQTVDNR